MKTSDGTDKTEAEPVSGGEAISLEAIKALEDALTFIGGNSRPIIGNRNCGAVVALSDLHRHLAGVAAVLDGIVDEIGHRVEQEVPVARSEVVSRTRAV